MACRFFYILQPCFLNLWIKISYSSNLLCCQYLVLGKGFRILWPGFTHNDYSRKKVFIIGNFLNLYTALHLISDV